MPQYGGGIENDRTEEPEMLSLHPLAINLQADRERAIRDRAPVPANRAKPPVHPAPIVRHEPGRSAYRPLDRGAAVLGPG